VPEEEEEEEEEEEKLPEVAGLGKVARLGTLGMVARRWGERRRREWAARR